VVELSETDGQDRVVVERGKKIRKVYAASSKDLLGLEHLDKKRSN